MVDEITPTGLAPPSLQQEIDAIADLPMNDVVNESPHAKAKRINEPSRCASFPWVVSTIRQNLKDVDEIGAATECDIQAVWDTYKSILQVCGYLIA